MTPTAALLLVLAPQTVQVDVAPPPPAASGFYSEVFQNPDLIGDLDGDAVVDFAVALGRWDSSKATGDSGLKVYSGATREVLLAIDFATNAAYKTFVEPVGDVDGDGVNDILSSHVGHPDTGGLGDEIKDGRVSVWSGRTGLAIRHHDGSNDEGLGSAVAGVGDLDGDGHDDYAVSSTRWGGARGIVRVFSGADGSVLQAKAGTAADQKFGFRVELVGDVNSDGKPDLMVSDLAGSSFDPVASARVQLYSPLDGVVFREHLAEPSEFAFGATLSSLGDIDFDGVPDYAINCPYTDIVVPGGDVWEDAGVVRVYDGATGGVFYVVHGAETDLMRGGYAVEDANGDGRRDFMLRISGPPYELRLHSGADGSLLESWSESALIAGRTLPDVDGDGSAEVLVWRWSTTSGGALQHGYLDLFRGLHASVPEDVITPRFGGRAGAAVALANLSVDDVADLVVSSPHEDLAGLDHGVVRALSGIGGIEMWRTDGARGAQLGSSLAVLDDLNSDGVPELALGAPRELTFVQVFRPGRVHVVDGATGAKLWFVDGISSGERFGASLANVGDVDGDGVADLAVGAPEYGGSASIRAGRVELVSGADGSELHSWVGLASAVRMGHAVAAAGDVDGDGVPDVAIGSPGRSTVQVRSGADGSVLWVRTDLGLERLGWSLAAIGDLDGDGVAELAAGAPGPFVEPHDVGRVLVLSGADGAVHADIPGELGDRFGTSVAAVGDIDLDGLADLAVGAPGRFQSVVGPIFGHDAGAVVVLSGADLLGAPLREWAGDTPRGWLGHSLASSADGDLDHDGIADLVAGSPGGDHDQGRTLGLSVRAANTNPFGLGTPGCDGAHRLVASEAPTPGTSLALRADAGPPLWLGARYLSLGADAFGTDFGFGCLFHLDPFSLFGFRLKQVSPSGVVEHPLTIPSDASLVGVELTTQVVFVGPAGACPALPGEYSSTPGLRLVIGE